MYNVIDFIRWALGRCMPDSVPVGAALALPAEECGVDPWQYLFGSVRVQTTQATLDRYYNEHYREQMTRAQYDAITSSWSRTGYATDCQGLLDAWFTYVQGVPTDINASMDYDYWCSEKGAISEITRPFVIGEAVFRMNAAGRIVHVGWVCGFDGDEPLIVEARNIRYGVVITRLSSRNFTHRGLMTKKFNYQEENMAAPIILKKTVPMMQGPAVLAVQTALNALGYTDAAGNAIVEDGRLGTKTMQALNAFVIAQSAELPEADDAPSFELPSTDGNYTLFVTVRPS